MVQPLLQIRQTPAKLSIDADPAQLSIRQPKAELTIQTTPGRLQVESYRPQLTVDQSKAWAAYHGGNMLEMNKRIYSGIQQLFMQNLAAKVERGNQVAEFWKPGNTIAHVYGSDTKPHSFPETRGPASYDNVDVNVQTQAPSVTFQPAQVSVDVRRNNPEIEFTRGKLDIYVQQHASLQFIPPELNVYT